MNRNRRCPLQKNVFPGLSEAPEMYTNFECGVVLPSYISYTRPIVFSIDFDELSLPVIFSILLLWYENGALLTWIKRELNSSSIKCSLIMIMMTPVQSCHSIAIRKR